MVLDTSALTALAAFAVVLAVLGAVFYGIVQSGKAAAAQDVAEGKQRAPPRQEEEVKEPRIRSQPRCRSYALADTGRPSGSSGSKECSEQDASNSQEEARGSSSSWEQH